MVFLPPTPPPRDGLKWKSGFLQKMSISLQKYNTKSTFLRKPNEERIMSRSFLSYGADFRTPWEGEILRKSRKKKYGSNNILGYGGVGTIPVPDSVSDVSWGIGGVGTIPIQIQQVTFPLLLPIQPY